MFGNRENKRKDRTLFPLFGLQRERKPKEKYMSFYFYAGMNAKYEK